jgi:transcriptional regulator with PAS, ATPase and Fis domain
LFLQLASIYKVGSKNLKEILEETEKKIIAQSLQQFSDKRAAAKALGISKSSMYEKLNKYDLL